MLYEISVRGTAAQMADGLQGLSMVLVSAAGVLFLAYLTLMAVALGGSWVRSAVRRPATLPRRAREGALAANGSPEPAAPLARAA